MPTTKRATITPDPVEEPSASTTEPTPEPPPAAAPSSPPVEPSSGQHTNPGVAEGGGGFGRWVRRLLRLVVLVALVVGVGGGIYFGWPIVYDRIIAPVQTNTSDLGGLRDRIAQQEAQVTELGAADASIQADIARLESRLFEHDRRLAALDAMDATLASDDQAAAETALRQVRLLKGMELMSRARLFLYQSNFGLAEQDIKTARDCSQT